MIIEGKIDILEHNRKHYNKPSVLFINKELFYCYKKEKVKYIRAGDFVTATYQQIFNNNKPLNILDDISIIHSASMPVLEPEHVPESAVMFTLNRIKRDMEFVLKHIGDIK